jgi:hypothetical protein
MVYGSPAFRYFPFAVRSNPLSASWSVTPMLLRQSKVKMGEAAGKHFRK